MKLWTIQTCEWWDQLEKRGRITGNWRYVDRSNLFHYRWMAAQMARRIGGHFSRCPIWAWKRFGGSMPKPDLRTSGLLPRGSEGLRIEFDADATNVLLSDFLMWHWVLNNDYLPLSLREMREWWKVERDLSFAERQARIVDSWCRIFDLGAGTHQLLGRISDRPVQACVLHISLKDVKSVTRFTAK